MTNNTVARRYAQALLMIAVEQNSVEQFQVELEAFRHSLAQEAKVLEIVANPRIQPGEKKTILNQLMAGKYSPVVTNYLNLIVDKRREQLFDEIIRAYSAYADEIRNVLDVEVRSAVQLADKDYRELEKKLSLATGKTARLRPVVDTSLLGGLVIKIGETVIDGSIAKRLSLLKKYLQQSPFEGIGVRN